MLSTACGADHRYRVTLPSHTSIACVSPALLPEEKLSLAACLWSSLSYIEAVFVISFVESFEDSVPFGNSWLHEAGLSMSCQKWA